MLRTRSYAYLVLNVVGATVLAVEAWLETQRGFLLLETAWALVAAWALAGIVRAQRSRYRRKTSCSIGSTSTSEKPASVA